MAAKRTRSGVVPCLSDIDCQEKLPEQIDAILTRVHLFLGQDVVHPQQAHKCRQFLARLYAWRPTLMPPVPDLERQVARAVFWMPAGTRAVVVALDAVAPSEQTSLLDLETDTLSGRIDEGAVRKFSRILDRIYNAGLERQLVLDFREPLQALLGAQFRDEQLLTFVYCVLHSCAWFYTMFSSEASPFNPLFDLLFGGHLPLSMTEEGDVVVYVQSNVGTMANALASVG